ncbi:putative nucleotide-diphospho-sugar transferase [Hoeflea poritis]|uniref:Nucleotide-diphospho-sugar transferase n=1 Tax=Hoeflea poritis TaxID=2993659 RepID=A0ABT4VS15_9HYPH|nr:putative nucleotide-diphospho-sugar transferase [Hoeflea poritis]MDA4847451.1 putative nucleotide-diphospho-sugar transferase [Hoeflea poritis]
MPKSDFDRANTTVFTVINRQYTRIAAAWATSVRSASGIDPTIVCSDQESHTFLSDRGFSCDGAYMASEYSYWKKSVWQNSGFKSDSATHTISLKFPAALKYLNLGRNIIFSDADAIWLSDPLPELNLCDFDIAFQPGSFPRESKEAWGFSICTGFFALRAGEPARRLCSEAVENFSGDDQICLNGLLLNQYDVRWNEKPQGWEHCNLHNGWLAPIGGSCRHSGLQLAALPHAKFQRHGTTRACVKHAVICHPNSPKSEAKKLKVFKDLSIPLDLPKRRGLLDAFRNARLPSG